MTVPFGSHREHPGVPMTPGGLRRPWTTLTSTPAPSELSKTGNWNNFLMNNNENKGREAPKFWSLHFTLLEKLILILINFLSFRPWNIILLLRILSDNQIEDVFVLADSCVVRGFFISYQFDFAPFIHCIIDGNSQHVAHAWSKIYLFGEIRLGPVFYLIKCLYLKKKTELLLMCAPIFELPSNISTMIQTYWDSKF